MPYQPLEPELEAFLLRVVPGLAEQWRGCTPGEIAQIERLAGHALPPFYRWFLEHMGQSMGPLAYASLDFSARQVIDCYTQGLAVPGPQFMLIGYNPDPMMPMHFFYDLALQVRADARVTTRHTDDDERYDQFETFREMLAHRAMLGFRVEEMPQRCKVLLKGDGPEFLEQLDAAMGNLGFSQPVPTGRCCRLYERQDAAMACSMTPRDEPQTFTFGDFGGRDAGMLRKLLGLIATESSLKVEVRGWEPPLG